MCFVIAAYQFWKRETAQEEMILKKDEMTFFPHIEDSELHDVIIITEKANLLLSLSLLRHYLLFCFLWAMEMQNTPNMCKVGCNHFVLMQNQIHVKNDFS